MLIAVWIIAISLLIEAIISCKQQMYQKIFNSEAASLERVLHSEQRNVDTHRHNERIFLKEIADLQKKLADAISEERG